MAPLSSSTAFPSNSTELRDEADFESILTPDGYLYVCGFGSLLSGDQKQQIMSFISLFFLNSCGALITSCRQRGAQGVLFPILGTSAWRFFGDLGASSPISPLFFTSAEISSLSVEPFEGEGLIVTVFEIARSEISSFIERENEFRFLATVPEDLDGAPFTNSAVLCARYSDEEYFQIRCKGSKVIYFQNYGRYNIHKIWRDDILPCRVYLRHCVLAAKNLGEAAYDNFLDHTFLSDRKTTIREYLSSTGSGIMEEEPPEALRNRYGG